MNGLFRIMAVLIFVAANVSAVSAAYTGLGGPDSRVIKGTVVSSEDNVPMDFVNVYALDTAGIAKASAFTGSDGEFVLSVPKKGRYTVFVSFLGYESRRIDAEWNGNAVDLGVIRLEPAGEQLEASVVSSGTLLRRESDRIVYDVSGDPDAFRMNMAEIMTKIPELKRSERNGNLVFEDEGITEIRIDDRISGMINVDRQYPMHFIQGAYMKTVEVILPGSPEYDNEKPILLIKLSRELPFGFASRLNGNAETTNSYSANADAVVNTPVTGAGLSYRFGFDGLPERGSRTETEISRSDIGYKLIKAESVSRTLSMNHNLGVNFFRPLAGDKVNLKLSINTVRKDSDSYEKSFNPGAFQDGIDSRTKTVSPMRFNGAFNISHSFGRRNSHTFTYTYSDNAVMTGQERFLCRTGDLKAKNTGASGERSHSASYGMSLNGGQKVRWGVNWGIDYINRHYHNSSEYYFYNFVTDDFMALIQPALRMNYRQQVWHANALYSGSAFRNGLSWGIGASADWQENRGTGIDDVSLDYCKFDITPHISLAGKLKTHQIRLRYSAKYNRPSMEQMNPYADISDYMNIRKGNPNLVGSVTNMFNVTYKKDFKSKIIPNISVSYMRSWVDNMISQVTSVDIYGASFTTWENLGSSHSNHISLSTTVRPLKPLGFSLSMSYNNSFYSFADGTSNVVNSFSGRLQMNLKLKYGFHIMSSMTVRPNNNFVQSRKIRLEPLFGLSLSKGFPKRNLYLDLSFSDILHGKGPKLSTISSDLYTKNIWTDRIGRSLAFSVTWNFGKFKEIKPVDTTAFDMKTD